MLKAASIGAEWPEAILSWLNRLNASSFPPGCDAADRQRSREAPDASSAPAIAACLYPRGAF
jgi:hypothetical protein